MREAMDHDDAGLLATPLRTANNLDEIRIDLSELNAVRTA